MPLHIDEKRSKASYMADFYVVPLAIVACFVLAFCYGAPALMASTDWFVAGLVLWLGFEYGLHRFFLHGPYKKQHWLHHIRPSEFISISTGATFAAFALLWLFASSISAGAGDFASGQFWFAGFYTGYFSYRYHHHCLHQWSDRDLQASRHFKPLHDAHELHHTGKPCNFGVQTLIFDKLFGTFRGS